jgi:hypothetical protein
LANFVGCQPTEYGRFGGFVDQDDPTNLPIGVAALARNCKFSLTSVKTRYGIQLAIQSANRAPITGLIGAIYTPITAAENFIQMPIIFDLEGLLQLESPVGTGRVVPIESDLITLPEQSHMIATQAFNCVFSAYSDLLKPTAPMSTMFLGTRVLDPFGWKPVGAGWIANKRYLVGDYVTPSYVDDGTTYARTTGHTYRCTTAGVTGATQPIWPLGTGATVTDGTAVWTESTMSMISEIPFSLSTPDDGEIELTVLRNEGTFPAGRDVYFIYTVLTLLGESLPNLTPDLIVNTTLNDGIRVAIAPDDTTYLPHYIGLNLYECDVPTGDPAPVYGDYKLVTTYQFGDQPIITESAVGAAPPVMSGADQQGDIAVGTRYMAVAFVNSLGTISGIVRAAIANTEYDATTPDYDLRVNHLPIGPSNTVRRIVAFTAAGGTASGPFFYIGQSQVSDGIYQTSTVINDNATTSVIFNFTDEFLIGSQGTNITDRLEVIEPNEGIDVYFSATTGRIFQCGVPGYYSGCWVSLGLDAESFYGADRSVIPIGADDGQRTWCIREYKETIYALRERSAFVITPTTASATDPTAGDPANWAAVQRWGPTKAGDGSSVGPCGPRAADVCKDFMFFVHRSGGYLYTDSQPECVTKEQQKFWNTINWKAAQTICVSIDEEEKEVHVLLPVGGSTVPNVDFTINYEEGWQSPITFSRVAQKEITIESCRKMSLQDVSAFVASRIERTIPDTPVPNEGPVGTDQGPTRALVSQFLYGSSGPDGGVHAITPGVYNDNGAGIDHQYETVAGENMLVQSRIQGANFNIRGNGAIQVSFLAGRKMVSDFAPDGTPSRRFDVPLRVLILTPDMNEAISRMCRPKTNERWRTRITNGNQPDVWFDLKYLCMFSKPTFTGRNVLSGN